MQTIKVASAFAVWVMASTCAQPISEETVSNIPSASLETEIANTTEIPIMSSIPDTPVVQNVTEDLCSCYVAVNRICVNTTLPETLAAAVEGDVVSISGNYAASEPMNISVSLTLQGITCGDKISQITTLFKTDTPLIPESREASSQKYALFNIVAASISVTLQDLKLQRGQHDADSYGTALYSEFGIGLELKNVEISNMRAFSHGGSAVYIATAVGSVHFDDQTKIIDNSVADGGCNEDDVLDPYCPAPNGGPDLHLCPDRCFGGGGAVWIGSCFGAETDVNVSANFHNNYHEFGHGMGGAVFMDWVQCEVHFVGNYTNNTSSDGGAIHIESIQEGGSIEFDGHYENNQAVEGGWGARGAANRVRDMVDGSTLAIRGTYIGNRAAGRGGVMAQNNIDGTVTMEVVAEGNVATRGSATSVHGVISEASIYTLAKECVFTDNEVEDDTLTDINLYNEHDISEVEFNADYYNKVDYVVRIQTDTPTDTQ
ncbi:hypothetical protein SARC_08307 [Sphaeroforma arctica JP610]|uniref:Right handed beta helix domain-containing protein n=1 Tax=Sphaeroforma arctica JP610 TaxID=667725 RepID=A0A0L0FR58_9EUKA|nr:hypothetical protein SARC_08307 [Sphaeroforma arctica JP610]KNC79302.1 hypothetical protein SARC_08307 [Sphaeroforma arctica JP610]|eukprot:XP_014153204.1 hypothetical protein SARC_08307 [Sphaeroforma arctica JP610]